MKEFSVKIKALTPLWTGDVKGEGSVLRETGIIGSLRWWYEIVLRGLGERVCDPTDKEKSCSLDSIRLIKDLNNGKSIHDALNEQICPVCQLFGCTGWSRKFKIEIVDNTIPIEKAYILARKKQDQHGKPLMRSVSGVMSQTPITIKFIPIREITLDEWILLNATLQLIANYGALGAWLSQGNGVIKITENNLPNPKLTSIHIKNTYQDKENNYLPNLNNLFFHKYEIEFNKDILSLIKKNVFWTHDIDNSDISLRKGCISWETYWNNYNFVPIAYHIRDAIRHIEEDKDKRHNIFGELGKGSKVFVSQGYKIDDNKVKVRIWGYDVDNDIQNKIKNKLYIRLKANLFSKEEYKDYLKSCNTVEEKTGEEVMKEILEGFK